jgi:hypothetical protein
MNEGTKCSILWIVLLFLMAEAIMLTEPPLVYLILLVASLGFILIGLSLPQEDVEDTKYCVIMLHYNGAEYAEVIHCPFQVPDEAVYSGSFEECKKWADGFNDTE